MHFSLVGGERRAAEPGLSGSCPGCGAPMVAKCGEQRLWHWAHQRARMCDDWWEPETDWHRAWKNNFDAQWQEAIRYDEASGEKHIADVLTEHGLVLEFQHSALNPVERAAREAFHRNMVWVVDGTRLKRDFPRFFEATDFFERTTNPSVFLLRDAELAFPKSWLASRVPVFFDFRNGEKGDMRREQLWCLLPGRANGHAVIAVFSPASLVEGAKRHPRLFDAEDVVKRLDLQLRERALRQEMIMLARQRMYLSSPRVRFRPTRRQSRRW